jgi:hypothetical protein
MMLILSANGSGILKWWVDASFVVHPHMCGHWTVLGTRISHRKLHQAEAQYAKLYIDRLHASYLLGSLLHESAGLQCQGFFLVPG